MRATVERGELLRALAVAARALPRTAMNPTITGYHLSQSDGELTVTCTDLHLTIRRAVTSPGDDGAVVAPGALARLVKAMPDGAVTLSTVGERLTVSAGDANADTAILDLDQWPQLPVVDGPAWTVPDTTILSRVVSMASPDEKRAAITGLYSSPDGLMVTDSYRAAIVEGEFPEALIPATAWAAALRDCDGELTVAAGERVATLASKGTSWTCSMIHEEYPPLPRLFPADPPHRLAFDAEALSELLARLSAVDSTGDRVIIRSSGQTAELKVGTDDASVVDTIDVEGWVGEITFGRKFLADAVAAANVEQIVLQIVDHLKPVTILSPGLRQLMMPIRLGR